MEVPHAASGRGAANTVKVLYFSHGTPELYAMIRERAPAGYEVVTLDADDDAERLAKIADCEIVVVGAYRLGAAAIAAARRLRLVLHQGVGYHDTTDWQALAARGIRLALTPEGTSSGVAEHAVMLMLATMKRLAFVDAELRAGRFHINSLRAVTRELKGRTVGFVGMGRIGQEVATRLVPWGITGIYADPVPLAPARERALGLERVDLETLLARADIVTLHLPLTPATRHLMNDGAFARMRPGAFLVNTARGPIVDEAALCRALASGRLAGAGLDVYETEPPGPGRPLFAFPNVVLTPHVAAGTRDAFATKMTQVFANADRFYAGEAMLNEVSLG